MNLPLQQAPAFRPGSGLDYTGADLSSHLQPVAGRGQVLVTFEYGRVAIQARAPGQKNRMETRLMVRLKPMGDRYTEAIETISEDDAMRLYPTEFSHFKNYQSAPTRGTPLSELPGISQSMIGLCIINGLRSVEDLASITDDIAAQAGLDVSTAHRIAAQWIARRDKNAKMIEGAEQVSRLHEENQALKDRLSALEVQVKAQELVAQQLPPSVTVPPAYRGELAGQIMPGQGADLALPDLPIGGGDVVSGNGDFGDDPNPLR